MRKIIFVGLMLIVLVLFSGGIEAGVPKISNLKFSDSPIILGEWFTITVEFEGDVDRLFIENIWETQSGEIKQELKEYTIPSDIKEKPKGVIVRQWKTVNPSVKPYRILKVWVKDANGNQSNILSGEVKIRISEVPKDVSPTPFVLGEKCEVPIWNIGDKWTYKTTSGGTWSIEVIENKEDSFIVREGRGKVAYDKKSLNIKFLIDDMGNKTKCDWRLRNKLDFPIVLNKKWVDKRIFMQRGRWWTFVTEYKITGIEEVNTPAGSFKAYKIYCKDTNMDDSTCTGDAYFWYSPEAKNWIKQEFRSSVPHWGTFEEGAVIIRYKLK